MEYCKNTTTKPGHEDMHNLLWNERTILTIVSKSETQYKVKNINGFEWWCDKSTKRKCLKNGDYAI